MAFMFISHPDCVFDIFLRQSESGPVLRSGLCVKAGGSDLRRRDGLSEGECVFRPLATLPRAERQGKPHSLQRGHTCLPERGEAATRPPHSSVTQRGSVLLPNKLHVCKV